MGQRNLPQAGTGQDGNRITERASVGCAERSASVIYPVQRIEVSVVDKQIPLRRQP
jgi:hypothetical protein